MLLLLKAVHEQFAQHNSGLRRTGRALLDAFTLMDAIADVGTKLKGRWV